MKKNAAADVVIFGGGVAGLWLLNRLRKVGLSAILFDSGALGGGQTYKSQGIIHGGMKYALQGVFTQDAQAMAEMPERWKQCLEGNGEINLSGVAKLSVHHYLWAPTSLASKFTGFLASATLASKVEPLSKENYPDIFQHGSFKGKVFALDEMVIDVPALIRELVKANQDAIFKIEPVSQEALKLDQQGRMVLATVYMSGQAVEVTAQRFIFTAGAGNEVIIKKLNQADVAMQRRPLHMVLVKMPFDCSLYAHCLGFGARPRLTITTHRMQDGSSVWYLGGLLAEEGVVRSSQAQIESAREELCQLFPWLDFTTAEYATFMVDRAEPLQKNGLKPESSYVKVIENMMIAWPTKLALAPKLADDIMMNLERAQLVPQRFDTRELRSWPIPSLAKPIWEELFCKNVQ